MSETQRNTYDVIMELINLHLKLAESWSESVKVEDIEKLYIKYANIVADVNSGRRE